MKRLLVIAALPALILAVALLLVRLVLGSTGLSLGPELGMAYAGFILVLLAIALVGAAFSAKGTPFRNLKTWGSVALSFGAVALLDQDYEAWQYERVWGEPPADLIASSTAGPEFGPSDQPIVLERQFDGHYYINAEINGVVVNFLVDTGATGVALTRADARRIGLQLGELDYSANVSTANGRAQAAPVLIRQLNLPGASFNDVPALVMQNGGRSLLGMEVLGAFSSVEMRQDMMILRR